MTACTLPGAGIDLNTEIVARATARLARARQALRAAEADLAAYDAESDRLFAEVDGRVRSLRARIFHACERHAVDLRRLHDDRPERARRIRRYALGHTGELPPDEARVGLCGALAALEEALAAAEWVDSRLLDDRVTGREALDARVTAAEGEFLQAGALLLALGAGNGKDATVAPGRAS